MGTVSTTLPSDGQTIDASDVNTPINAILSEFNGNIDDNNIKTGANINGAKLLAGSIPGSSFDSTIQGGWVAGVLPAQSGTITNNGNRSYDIPFASTVASILTPGMRLRTTRTVTAPTYMGGLMNGSSHYFTKVTATSTLSTVTNNFSMKCTYMPTAYPSGTTTLMGRSDAAGNNGFALRFLANGTLDVAIFNAGAANYRSVGTYQSLPLNKKSKIWASWSSGTVVIKLDGVTIPVATAATGGTAPTTAGTGGDFSVGRFGATSTQYAVGYISDIGVFDAVITPTTMNTYDSQALLGSETNCIGAWSLNNTGVNQQAAGTNDLTATGGVSYTSGLSPYGTDANGTSTGTTDYAIVTKVVTSTATVQVPEGCTIPTSGGVSAVAYSTQKAPYGMPVDVGRWEVRVLIKARQTIAGGAVNTFINANHYITVPVGQWRLGYMADCTVTHAGVTYLSFYTTLSTTNNTQTNNELTVNGAIINTSLLQISSQVSKFVNLPITSATPYYLNIAPNQTSTTLYVGDASAVNATSFISAEFNLL